MQGNGALLSGLATQASELTETEVCATLRSELHSTFPKFESGEM